MSLISFGKNNVKINISPNGRDDGLIKRARSILKRERDFVRWRL